MLLKADINTGTILGQKLCHSTITIAETTINRESYGIALNVLFGKFFYMITLVEMMKYIKVGAMRYQKRKNLIQISQMSVNPK